MNCEEALLLLSGHLDGQNTPEEETRLEAHLAGCSACRELLRAYEEIDAGLASLAALTEGVMGRIRARPKKRRHPWSGAAAAAAAALALLAGAGGLPNLRDGQASTSEAMSTALEAGFTPTARTMPAAYDPSSLETLLWITADSPEALAEEFQLTDSAALERGVQYETDAKTARVVAAACDGVYDFQTAEGLETAADDVRCYIFIAAE